MTLVIRPVLNLKVFEYKGNEAC